MTIVLNLICIHLILYLFLCREVTHKLHGQGEFLLKWTGYGYYWVTSHIISISSSSHGHAVPTPSTLPPACLAKDDSLPGKGLLPVVFWEPEPKFKNTKQTWHPAVDSWFIERPYCYSTRTTQNPISGLKNSSLHGFYWGLVFHCSYQRGCTV